jgi:hypothetical protein
MESKKITIQIDITEDGDDKKCSDVVLQIHKPGVSGDSTDRTPEDNVKRSILRTKYEKILKDNNHVWEINIYSYSDVKKCIDMHRGDSGRHIYKLAHYTIIMHGFNINAAKANIMLLWINKNLPISTYYLLQSYDCNYDLSQYCDIASIIENITEDEKMTPHAKHTYKGTLAAMLSCTIDSDLITFLVDKMPNGAIIYTAENGKKTILS